MDVISRAIDAVKSKNLNAEIKLDEPMKNHTSFKIGGPVRVMLFPGDSGCLIELLDILGGHGVTPYIVGNGTNILAGDANINKIVINTKKLYNISSTAQDDSTKQEYIDLTVDAGALLSKTAVYALERGFTGLEFAHGIPGTLGGAVVMNAGAYDGEMANVVHSTTVYNAETGKYTLTGAEHEFSYRHSRFSNQQDVVISSVIRLKKGDKELIKRKMDDFNNRRQASQPLDLPSAGSTFKRPKEGYAAAYIEQAGLKGFAIGGAAVSELHAGFVVNRSNASFADTMAVIEHVKKTVLNQFNVELELEVKVLT
jgi:UDP-N-acetylmuramate dehydrogenase